GAASRAVCIDSPLFTTMWFPFFPAFVSKLSFDSTARRASKLVFSARAERSIALWASASRSRSWYSSRSEDDIVDSGAVESTGMSLHAEIVVSTTKVMKRTSKEWGYCWAFFMAFSTGSLNSTVRHQNARTIVVEKTQAFCCDGNRSEKETSLLSIEATSAERRCGSRLRQFT